MISRNKVGTLKRGGGGGMRAGVKTKRRAAGGWRAAGGQTWPKETAPAERAKTLKAWAAAEQKATGSIFSMSLDVTWIGLVSEYEGKDGEDTTGAELDKDLSVRAEACDPLRANSKGSFSFVASQQF